jgi:hypothetical protein
VAFAEWYKSSVFDKALQADRRVSRIPRFQIAIENDERGVAADGECREVDRRLCAQWTSGRATISAIAAAVTLTICMRRFVAPRAGDRVVLRIERIAGVGVERDRRRREFQIEA